MENSFRNGVILHYNNLWCIAPLNDDGFVSIKERVTLKDANIPDKTSLSKLSFEINEIIEKEKPKDTLF